MKLSVSAYRAHASAHKKILDTAYQLNYGSTSASSHQTGGGSGPVSAQYKVESLSGNGNPNNDEPSTSPGCPAVGAPVICANESSSTHLPVDSGSDTPVNSPRSPVNTSRDEDDSSSNAQSSDCKSPNQRYGGGSPGTKSNQRWMKLRTTVQISSAIQKKPPLKREDSFLKRFSTRQIPETQETVEDTGSEGGGGTAGGGPQLPRRRRIKKNPRTVVNPDENFYFYWLFVLTICVLYNMWALIVRQSFPEFQKLASRFWMTCDAMSDIVFLLDVGVQLRTGYLEQGLMVYDSKKLAGHYLHSRPFLLDLGALCPLDLLQVRFGPQPMLRFPRFLKVYRAINYYYMVESRTVWPNLWRVVNLIHILLILAHWFGCFYFLLSEAEGFQGDWVYPYRPGDYATLTRKYLGSLYWSTLTLTTIGDLPTPETNAEKTVTVDGPKSLPRRGLKSRLLQFKTDGGYVFTIVSYLIGVFIFATIVGQVGNVITNRNANRLEFERLLDGAKTYMRHHKVPSGMKKRVLRWYDYSWSRGRIQGGGDINTALGLLPDKLKTELALHVNLSVLKKVTIFQECQPEFLHDLVLKMKAYIFTPGDSICRKGEVAREMFIIADGILEVLSEAGRVLTTMKAGDFFGEIGILNLDGLNKRTADVRSVGYSELFSLSREDVLAAMKDYPEAQEILQSLGRKRLMEVRNSARLPPHRSSKHHRDHGNNDPGPGDGAKGLVGKIKSEAKGLRNVLRKSRYRKSDESLELQPLHTPSKGVLKRMPRVKSDEMCQDDIPDPGGGPNSEGNTSTITSPLGAGLPLLSRLQLLKEKQKNEDRNAPHHQSSGITSPSSAIISPSPIPEQAEPEVIGAGLPLLQRLLLLKAKEDRIAAAAVTTAAATVATAAATVAAAQPTASAPPSASTVPRKSPSPALSPKPVTTGKVSFRDRIFALKSDSPPKNAQSSSDKKLSEIKTMSSSNSEVMKETNSEKIESETPDVVKDTTESIKAVISKEPSEDICDDTRPWSKLKHAAIIRDNSQASMSVPSSDLVTSTTPDTATTLVVKKPNLLNLQNSTKHYESVDDLSPEYGGLPFVKKLKILNERQKLLELETAMKTRSASLDIPDSSFENDLILTRSHSEASAMHKRNRLAPTTTTTFTTSTPQQQQPPLTSPESNETPERRNLKSILKKLSEDVKSVAPQPAEPDNKPTQLELRKLMRAPTVEGYAARHSKLSKSVTFNRDTLQSPPSSLLPGNNETTVSLDITDTMNHEEQPEIEQEIIMKPPESPVVQVKENNVNVQMILPNQGIQKNINKGPIDEHEYFGEALIAIKHVISAHLQEMQIKFQQRFDRLEQEVRSRDSIIGQLRQHIHELETSIDDSYTGSDSIDTVIHRPGDRRSWDEPNNQESFELQDLPDPLLRPQRAWSPPDSVVLDLDSATDTESEMGDSSDQGDTEDTYTMHNTNWEVEMLVAQMRQQRRSASFDHNASSRQPPATRRRLCRGYSADTSHRD